MHVLISVCSVGVDQTDDAHPYEGGEGVGKVFVGSLVGFVVVFFVI